MHRGSRIEVYVHVVWGTHRRRRQITAAIEADLHRVVQAKALELGCEACAIGGTEDHLHLLARLHPAVPLARLVAQVKGGSSHFLSHQSPAGRAFQWQSGYGGFSIAPSNVPAVRR